MKIKKSPLAQCSTATLRPALFIAILFLGIVSGFGQTTWDFGGTPDKNWSTFTNWSTDASPASTAVVFSGTGTTAASTTIGNIVDQGFTINSLSYTNTSNWQVTQIASGQTLTIDAGAASGNSLLVGGFSTNTTTQAAFTGSGTLTVSSTAANITVSNGGSTSSRATLDMSALSTFTANVNAFNVGTSGTAFGTLYLADNSTITANSMSSGGSGSGYSPSAVSNKIYFGTTTVLNVNSLSFGQGRTVGSVQFRPASSGAAITTAVSGATLKIRGTDGVSRATTMKIGDLNETGAASNSATTTMDLTGGTVDAMVGTLTVGISPGSLSSSYGATLSMASGTFDATTVIVGQTINNSTGAGTLTGNLNVSGGLFKAGTMTLANNLNAGTRATKGNLTVSASGTVAISGGLVMGSRTGATVTPTVNVSGGMLSVAGGIAEGTGAGASINSTINLSGSGTLDMKHSNIAVDSFNFTGGTLKNVGSFNASTTGGLNLQNTSTLAYDLDGSFTPLTLTGTFSLSVGSNLAMTLADNVTPVTFTLVNNDLSDSITGTFATINDTAFGPDNTFFLTNNLGTFEFQLSYTGGDGNDLTATAIPEPGTWGMILSGFGMLIGFQRLRRRRVGT